MSIQAIFLVYVWIGIDMSSYSEDGPPWIPEKIWKYKFISDLILSGLGSRSDTAEVRLFKSHFENVQRMVSQKI